MKGMERWGAALALVSCAVLGSAGGVIAQDSALETATGTAADLVIEPRFGGSYNSSGGGYDGFGQLEGFVPFWQTPGQAVGFSQTRLILDNGARFAASTLLGYRLFDDTLNRTWGGYVGYDYRRTEFREFHQLGFGLETLGDLDVRLNGYLPIASGPSRFTPFFGGNFLFIDQVALAGADLEIGGRLLEFGEAGELRSYVRGYYQRPESSQGWAGVEVRLEARPNDLIRLSAGVQHDAEFGTNLLFRVGAGWGGVRSRAAARAVSPVLARLDESVGRAATIAVDDVLALNPATGKPYFFHHVTLGSGGGDGTVGSPFGSLAEALSRVVSDGNQIVYVDAGSGATIAPFTLPANVQLLSTGPVQLLNVRSQHTARSGVVQLPRSGTGVLPRVAGTVGAGNGVITLGSNTTVSGFEVQVLDASTPGDGIRGLLGRNVSNVTIRNNRVSNAIGEGIYLENATEIVRILDNTVLNTRMNTNEAFDDLNGAIFLTNNRGNADVLISGNRVETTFNAAEYNVDGIEINLCRQGSPFIPCAGTATATVRILNNTVLNQGTVTGGADGIDINLDTGAQLAIEISNNTVVNFPDKGISFGSVGNGIVTTATIANNVIQDMGQNGIHVRARVNSRFNEMTIRDNQVTNVAGRGIDVSLDNDDGALPPNTAIATVLIENNRVVNAGDDGIRVNVQDAGRLNATVRGNTIVRNNGATGGDGRISMRSRQANSVLCLRLENNVVVNSIPTQIDYFFRRQVAGAVLELSGLTAPIATTGGAGVAPLPAALTNLGNQGNRYRVQNQTVQVPTAACTAQTAQ